MKKFLAFFVSSFICLCSIFAFEYKIRDVEYDITGCGYKIFGQTQPYSLSKQVPVDKKTIFANQAELENYIKDYTKKLQNLRAFETIQVDYNVLTEQETIDEENLEPQAVKLIVTVKDSFHLFGIPGPKYDSNTGLILKLKIKDTNFLGSLNTLSSDFYLMLPTSEADGDSTEFGFNANFDYPFKLGIFDATWLNDFGLSYTVGDDMPEWNITTGLRFELPVSNHFLVFEAKQKFINNFAYQDFDDNLYFENVFNLSFPLKIGELNYCGPIRYTPYLSTTIDYDHNGISKLNSALSSPIFTAGHKLSFGRIDWLDNFRTGINFSIDNYYSYNIQRNRFYPIIQLDTTAYKKIDLIPDSYFLRSMGICANIITFAYMYNPNKDKYINNDGKPIGKYLRGIRDAQSYAGTNIDSLTTTSAFILNFDLPFHIFSTNFQKGFLKYFNFELQLSPFFDMALCYNKVKQSVFNPKDGYYAAGLEMIVYPLKWSGITIRGSVGIDIGRKFFSQYLNTDWRDNTSKKEFSLGFGLHY